MASVEEVRGRPEALDRAVRDGDPVPTDDLSINATSMMRRYSWGNGVRPAALTKEALQMLGMQDRTYDKRWVKYFDNRANEVAVYRSTVGFYWLFRYDSAHGEHWLDHIGTAAKTLKRFGVKEA